MPVKEPLPRTNILKRLFCLSMSPRPRDSGCHAVQGDQLMLDLSRAPELNEKGGALRLESADLPDRVLVVHGPDGGFHAYRNRCACGGFRIDPVPGEGKVRCVTPMQSTYDGAAGKPLTKMVERSVDVLPVEESGSRLVIDIALLQQPPPHKRKDN